MSVSKPLPSHLNVNFVCVCVWGGGASGIALLLTLMILTVLTVLIASHFSIRVAPEILAQSTGEVMLVKFNSPDTKKDTVEGLHVID